MFTFGDLEFARPYMVAEVEQDRCDGTMYLSKRLTDVGKAAYPSLLLQAAKTGTEQDLVRLLADPTLWLEYEMRTGNAQPCRVPRTAHKALAECEFNVYYMRGLCQGLIATDILSVEVYRAKSVSASRQDCSVNAGDILSCTAVLADLRSREDGAGRIGIPRGPGSGVSLRRPAETRHRVSLTLVDSDGTESA